MIATVEESDEVSALTRSTPSSSSATAPRGGPSPPDERTSSPTLHDRSAMMAPQNAHGNRGLVVLLMEGLPKGDATPEVRAKFRQELEAVLRHDDVGALAPGATLAASAPLVLAQDQLECCLNLLFARLSRLDDFPALLLLGKTEGPSVLTRAQVGSEPFALMKGLKGMLQWAFAGRADPVDRGNPKKRRRSAMGTDAQKRIDSAVAAREGLLQLATRRDADGTTGLAPGVRFTGGFYTEQARADEGRNPHFSIAARVPIRELLLGKDKVLKTKERPRIA